MNSDKLEIEILADGTIKLTSDPISAPNHASAGQFFKIVAKLAGGETNTAKRTDVHRTHSHGEHEHEHEHQ